VRDGLKDIRQKLLATFQAEHRDHLEQIRSLVARIVNGGLPPARPDLEEIFRRAHSLKGAARAVDLRAIEELAHRLETLFSRVLSGACPLDREVEKVVLQVLDATEDCTTNQRTEPFGAALRAIDGVLGVETESQPEPAREASENPPVPAFQPLETVRITAGNFDSLFRSAGSLVAETQYHDETGKELSQFVTDLGLMEREGAQARRFTEVLRGSDARHAGQLTSLLGSIEQRARSLSRKARLMRRTHHRRTWRVRQLGKQLQQDVRRARMMPAESLLDGYRKMMRDLARDEGREIEFQATSTGVHADRRVLDALRDPIMHMLRNAVSHGIEPALERTAKGKRAAGLVTLVIGTEGQRLTVAVEDDGRGVDFARVAEVAIEAGILTGTAAADSPQDLTRILFRPGFSTSRAVTTLSGRGMGLSVVYEAVRRLQGDIDARPGAGGGTRLFLSVPLSIASQRLIVVNSGSRMFAIPLHGIERVLRIKRSSVETSEGRPVIVMNGQPAPLTNIYALLGLPYSSSQTSSGMLQVVIVRSGGRRIALAVDALVREVDLVIQDLAEAASCGGRISSGVVLDDGSIAFVVNPMELMESALHPGSVPEARQESESLGKSPDPAATNRSSYILVVDDSMTTRALEKSILEAHGFQVRVAVDGVDALNRLREERADLVIADVEMPRLNGFGLIAAMKKDAELGKIPVIIVSSVERREDQERGLALGADAYIVKQRFDQEQLLSVIRQIL
jgi:two-component system chemotaxis sensor kinase CheA